MTSELKLAAVPLLPSQRRDRIVEFLRRSGAVTLQQLAQAIDVSVSTLRRDLDALETEGLLDRTHGGALLRQQHYRTFEPATKAAAELSPKEKRAIGRAAAAALVPGQSVIFDSGTTVMEAARAVLERDIDLVAVTNDIAIAQILGASRSIQVHVLGGSLRPHSNTLVGEGVLQAAKLVRADVYLMGVHAVTDGVLSETSVEVCGAKRALMNAAGSTRLLVDSSKFRPRAFMAVCDVTDIDEVITDASLNEPAEDALRNAGVKLVKVTVQ